MTAEILKKLLHLYDTHSLVYHDGTDVWCHQTTMELFEEARVALAKTDATSQPYDSGTGV